jgi:uncharacterized surface protein with fasciclin (FAS1) repeats
MNDNNNGGLITAILVLVIVAVVAVGGIFLLSGDGDDDSDNDTNNEANDRQETEDTDSEEPSQTIAEIATADSDLSTLVTALEAAELVDVVADENANLTVFAPTNAAFAEIEDTVNTLLEPENQADLQNVLQYHVVDGAAFSGDLSDGQVIETLNGETLTVEIRDGDVFINDAQVVIADVEASNGVVHVIDTVLVP